MLLESDMTEEVFNIEELIASSVKGNRKSSGGRGKSTDPSQLDVLGLDGLQFIQNAMKSNGAVKASALAVIGSEWFRKESVDWVLAKKYESAKKFTKVTVEDLDLKFIDGSVKKLSTLKQTAQELLATAKTDAEKASAKVKAAALFKGIEGYGEVHIKNEQFTCEWPLSAPVNVRKGDPKATDLAPILAPWSLFIEACEKYAVNQ